MAQDRTDPSFDTGIQTIYQAVRCEKGSIYGAGPAAAKSPVDGVAVYATPQRQQASFYSKEGYEELLTTAVPYIDRPASRKSAFRSILAKITSHFRPDRRVSLTAYMAYPGDKGDLIKRTYGYWLTRWFGGCSISEVDGCWSEDGSSNSHTYSGYKQEQSIRIYLSVMPESELCARNALCSIGNAFTSRNDPKAPQWLHIERSVTRAAHADLQTYPRSHEMAERSLDF